ncbi:MAG: hypothetical protein ACKPKO_28085, partial [Candidatus Fonsibacter sp.]
KENHLQPICYPCNLKRRAQTSCNTRRTLENIYQPKRPKPQHKEDIRKYLPTKETKAPTQCIRRWILFVY